MKYLVNKVNADGRGIAIKETLEEAKKEWASMYIEVYEATDEQVDFIRTNFKRDEIDKVSDYIKDNCKFICKD